MPIVCVYFFTLHMYAAHTTHQSFRFGPEIAYVSALLLRTLKGVRQQTLVGSTEEGWYTIQGLIQDYQLLVVQEGGGNQTCFSTLVLFSMYTLEILGRKINLRGRKSLCSPPSK